MPEDSDNGIPHYLRVEAPDRVMLPRIDVETPIIYRGERFCRYPGCTDTSLFLHSSNLRTHYRRNHDFTRYTFSTSVSPAHEEVHDAGKRWLAKAFFYQKNGWEFTDQAPVPLKW